MGLLIRGRAISDRCLLLHPNSGLYLLLLLRGKFSFTYRRKTVPLLECGVIVVVLVARHG